MGLLRPIAERIHGGVWNEINRIALSIVLCRAQRGTVAARNNDHQIEKHNTEADRRITTTEDCREGMSDR